MGQILPQVLEWNLSYQVERKLEKLSSRSLPQASPYRASTVPRNWWWASTQTRKVFLIWWGLLCSGSIPTGHRWPLSVREFAAGLGLCLCSHSRSRCQTLSLFYLLPVETSVSLQDAGCCSEAELSVILTWALWVAVLFVDLPSLMLNWQEVLLGPWREECLSEKSQSLKQSHSSEIEDIWPFLWDSLKHPAAAAAPRALPNRSFEGNSVHDEV